MRKACGVFMWISPVGRGLVAIVFVWLLCSLGHVASSEVQSDDGRIQCHRTYFIRDYYAYDASTDGPIIPKRWQELSCNGSNMEAAEAGKKSTEMLLEQISLLEGELRRERSRRKSLVYFADSLITRYSNSTQVIQTWRRFSQKYKMDLNISSTNSAEQREAALGEEEGQEQEAGSDNLRKRDRRPRKRSCCDGSEMKKLNEMKGDMESLKRSYAVLFTGFRRLGSSHRNLQREVKRYIEQGARLRMFHLTEVQRLSWALANETDLWHAGVRYLMGKISCMEEENKHSEACLNLDPSLRRQGPVRNTSKTSDPQARSDTGRTQTIRERKHDRVQKADQPNLPSPEPFLFPKKENRAAEALSIHADLKPDVTDSRADVDVNPTGVARNTQLSAAQGSVIDYDRLQSSITEAGIEVFKQVLGELHRSRAKDCSEIDLWQQRHEPHQTIFISGHQRPVRVYCDNGWTVIQHNKRQSTPPPPRVSNAWAIYRDGFGLPDVGPEGPAGFFWIGNEYIHKLTSQGDYRLKVELKASGWSSYTRYSEYAHFAVKSEREMYALVIGGGSGTAGDIIGPFSSTSLNGVPFATRDRNSDGRQMRLTTRNDAGWWYPLTPDDNNAAGERCFANLNAGDPTFCDPQGQAVAVDSVVMKIRPNTAGRS